MQDTSLETGLQDSNVQDSIGANSFSAPELQPLGEGFSDTQLTEDNTQWKESSLDELPQLGEKTENPSNIFSENGTATLQAEEDENEKESFVSKYIRWFVVASIVTVVDILLIGLIFSYNIYIQQTSLINIDQKYASFIPSYKQYLEDFTSMVNMNQTLSYRGLQVLSLSDEGNLRNIMGTSDLTYAQKKDILKEKATTLSATVMNNAREINQIQEDIARFGFLPQEIRGILQGEDAISAIQRSLNSLEIIKFSTALKVFSYMDSVAALIGDSLRVPRDEILDELAFLSERGERDVSAYVYMCYLNPFETSQDCSSIGDFDLYFQSILKDEEFNRTLFKGIMRYIDIILEQSDIPSFSILFNGFDANQQIINFDIEVNTTKDDELKLIARGIRDPHIFILTSLINLLKQSMFIIGGEIDTKTINITTRTINVGDNSYVVNSSSKKF